MEIKLFFTDYYEIDPDKLDEYGAFNISLRSDLPLFIDPFLLFNSKKKEYQDLHDQIIKYLMFLGDNSDSEHETGFLKYYYRFPEVTQNWLGFSKTGNSGRGLGNHFAKNLNNNLDSIFVDFGSESVTKGSHLEKLCLVQKGVGNDSISDFTTNLIKEFLLDYTETFAKKYLDQSVCKNFTIGKVKFNYETESWESKQFFLPEFNGDYIILTPKDILTKGRTWINHDDLARSLDYIVASLSNEELRAKLNNYLTKILKSNAGDKKKKKEAKVRAFSEFPELIDYYIRYKEENGNQAIARSSANVKDSEILYMDQFSELTKLILNKYESLHANTYDETKSRIEYMKHVIENNDGYKLLYKNGKPISTENDLQILFRFVWYKTNKDVNREPNNGRGPVDYKISLGNADSTLAEFKLAKSSKLEQNLKNQLEVYENANSTKHSFKVIFYFTEDEFKRVKRILKRLELDDDPDIILIDCRSDNKASASNVK